MSYPQFYNLSIKYLRIILKIIVKVALAREKYPIFGRDFELIIVNVFKK